MAIKISLETFKNVFKKRDKLRKYNNVVEAAHWAKILLKLSGLTIFELRSLPGNKIVTKFSFLGFTSYLVWYSAYFYCTYITFYEDQTILRMLHNTKLRRYGDDFERCSSILFAITSMFLNPLRLNCNQGLMQKIVDIDVFIEKAGDIIDFDRLANTGVMISICEFIAYVIRICCTYFTLRLHVSIPIEKMFQMYMSDSIAMMTTSLYCYKLLIIIHRFKWINKSLREIKTRNSWEYKVFVRGNAQPKLMKVVEVQDKQVCQKIKTCAKVYSMLYDACKIVSDVFSFTLLITMLYYFLYIILYLFYFMEATATGLFHNVKGYLDFLLYTFWEITVALGIILLIIVFSEMTVAQANQTSFLVHDIINENFSPSINEEAMQFSLQLLHQKPVFSVCGLYNLDYAYLQQGTRSVSTYLIILLQFVMDTNTMYRD